MKTCDIEPLPIIGIQPPNDKALWLSVGMVVLLLIGWFALESRRFTGPPTGALIAERREQIAADEARVGGND